MNWAQGDKYPKRPKNIESVYGFNPEPKIGTWKPSQKPITNNDVSRLAGAYKGRETEGGMRAGNARGCVLS
jgi:hypothetical protein